MTDVLDPTAEYSGEYSARNTPATTSTAAAIDAKAPIGSIHPSPLNPRKRFNEGALAELAASIREHGIIEPLVVRPSEQPGKRYELVAGERRWRAAQIAGLEFVPVRILPGARDDSLAIQLAIIENLQRQDLDPIEEARGFQQLADVCGMRQAAIAAAIHVQQPFVSKRMALLSLPDDVRARISSGELSPAHGEHLAHFSAFPEVAAALAEMAISQKWTSKDLSVSLPGSYELERRKLVVDVTYQPFRKSVCQKACPYGALRKNDNYFRFDCLKPEHAKELEQAEADRARLEAIALAEQTRQASVPTEDDVAAATSGLEVRLADDAEDPLPPAAPEAPVAALPTLSELGYKCEAIGANTPSGCTGECPCRGRAISNSGRIVEICTDPRGRMVRLRVQDTKAKNKAARADVKVLQSRLKWALAGLAEIGPRELAILAGQTALHADGKKSADQAIADFLPGEQARSEYGSLTVELARDPERLAARDVLSLVKYALAMFLGGELQRAYEYGDGGNTTLTNWYLGDQAEASEADDAYPRESDVRCDGCKEPITVDSEEMDLQLARHHTAGGASYCGNCDDDDDSVPADVEDDQALDSDPYDVDVVAGGV